MALNSVNTAYQGQVGLSDLRAVASKLGFPLKSKDEPDMLVLLQGLDEQMQALAALPDFQEDPDISSFPRNNIVVTPKGAGNTDGAWACRCEIKGGDEWLEKGVLKGGTVCIKDNIAVAGVPCLFGTNVFDDWTPKTDATLVARILKAGGVITGKAVCENLCMTGASNTAASGPVENPYAVGFSAGGSSSGTGNLVAKGEVKYGIGADQGGSIRIPAANCGLVGLKPTFGLVPYTGCATGEMNLDYAGPMTRTVSENAELLEAIAGADGIDDRQGAGCPLQAPAYSALLNNSSTANLRGMRIGLLKEAWEAKLLDPSMSEKIRAAAMMFTTLGASVDEVSIPFHVHGPLLCQSIARGGGTLSKLGQQSGRRGLYMNDLAAKLSPITAARSEKMPWSTINAVVSGVYTWDKYPSSYGKAINLTRKLRNDYDKVLDEYDVLILPTLNYVPKRHAPSDATPLVDAMQWCQTVHTSPFNATGHPALTLPVGKLPPAEGDVMTENDREIMLPIGMQIVGKWWGEETIYRVAKAWEQNFDWKSL